ncbi:SusC/RagA family TonB-linked outer membrane protein [Chitinophaga alhagiae]|uniref:SusC/RagA family TonB-linked outer membrane protein n=1 Tax=Chitinophaga alhagiae TaxID=2203219 RepID=A0ABN5LNL6_9BACT|nr:SusC/RagA family TonB-linked outer membrane protein [Chitinophaga alhagiae]AWO00699.1 SusC/RagA family TonB-linked outer membrane protein [Chitinophaga alhagiae]
MGYIADLKMIRHRSLPRLYRLLALIVLFSVSIQIYSHAQQPQEERTLTLSGTRTIEEIFSAIQTQMGLTVTYEYSVINRLQKLRVNFKKATLTQVMERVLRGQKVGWAQVRGQVLLFENKAPVAVKKEEEPAQITVSGVITNPEGQPIPGATVMIKGTLKGTQTNAQGRFRIEGSPREGMLEISSMGYLARQFRLEGEQDLKFVLTPAVTQIEPVTVVSTGYQDLPKERSTGSFVFIDSALLHRRVGVNILDRLEGVTSGLLNYKTLNMNTISKMPTGVPLGISLRGLSTLSPNRVNTNPLVILDNFPYEGDIGNINPNDIESVTVLKDAASAGIWGARSGNGVIVLTTKRGKYRQKMTVDFNTNLTIVSKPNLYKDRNYMSAGDYIDVETTLFNKGYFDGDINNSTTRPPVSPAVEILAKLRSGTITDEEAQGQLDLLKSHDLRKDMLKYVYQRGVRQQYQVNVRGGIDKLAYFLSLGYDHGTDNLVRNGSSRVTATSAIKYRPVKKLEIEGYVNYGHNTILQHNELGYGNILVGGSKYRLLYPYASLADGNGNPLPTVRDYRANYVDSVHGLGFLDWRYRPLDEIRNARRYMNLSDLVLRGSLKYRIAPFLDVDIQFQNETQAIFSKNYRSEETYFSRNLINRFSVYDVSNSQFTYNFPRGGILERENYDWRSYSIRASLNYRQQIGSHLLTGIIGSELRELSATGTEFSTAGHAGEHGAAASGLDLTTLFPVNPAGQSTLNSALSMTGTVLGLLNRFISYYTVAGYSYKKRYDISASARRDGANIFGARTNQKLVPLWSVGGGWSISKEPFYNLGWLPNLRLRMSYGFNGNVYNGAAYLTGTRITDPLTGLPSIVNLTPANEELRWERVKIINTGLDFSLWNSRISGTVEYYHKEGLDLVEQVSNMLQTGLGAVNRNSGSILTKGFDVNLNSRILDKKLAWDAAFMVSHLKDRITNYSRKPTAASVVFPDPLNLLYVVGKPLRGVLSYKWAGLDPKNGDPQGYLGGVISKDYLGIRQNFNPDSLVYHGSATPTFFGAIRNDFTFKGVQLSFNITYKLGYYFRRPSLNLNYQSILNESMNIDYSRRWQRPGDEAHTDVPALSYPSSSDRNLFYRFSEVMVEKGDHIRLQDIRLGYNIPVRNNTFIKNMEAYCYLNNVGIIWRANKFDLDPEVYSTQFANNVPNPFSISIGFQANF